MTPPENDQPPHDPGQLPAGPPPQQWGPPPGQPGYGQPPGYGAPPTPHGHGQPPYGQPPYGQPVNRGTNGFAIASMVLGIIWIYWIGSILALIFGYIALAQIKRDGTGGRGMAIAGIVLGWIGVGTLILTIIFAVVSTTSTPY